MELVAEDKKVEDANFEYSTIDTQFEIDSAKQSNEQKIKISKAEAEILKENLDEKVMRFNAMESAKKCLANKRFNC